MNFKTLIKQALEKSRAFKISTFSRHIIQLLVNRLQKLDSDDRYIIDLTKDDFFTKAIKHILNKLGCFDFYSTNSGEYIIGVSQVVYFIHIGFKLILKGIKITKDSHQIHHKSGNKRDNRIENLVLLTIEDHKLVTKIQNATLDVSCYEPEVEAEAVRYNNQGHKVKDVIAYLNTIIAETLEATERWLTRTAQGRGRVISVKKTVEWIKKHLKSVKQFRVLAGLQEPEVPYEADKSKWDALTKLINEPASLEIFGSCFDFTVNDMLVS